MTVELPVTKRTGPGEFETKAIHAATVLNPSADLLATTMSLGLFRVTNRLQRDLEVNVYRSMGVSGAAYSLMFVIKSVGPVSPKDLATLSSTSTASTSSLLNTLQKYGFITRKTDELDGRKIIVELTPGGEDKLAELFMKSNERETLWAAGLSDTEAIIFLELLRKLLRHRPEQPASDPAPSE